MNDMFEGLSVTDILQPGEVYLLSHRSKECPPESLECLYLIRTEDELKMAVMMEFQLLLVDDQEEFRKYLGVEKVEDDEWTFTSLLFNRFEEEEHEYSIYLYQLRPFREEHVKMTEIFPERFRVSPELGNIVLSKFDV